MAVSIWTKPAELKLTPIPFEAMMMATQAKDKAYKQNVDKIDAYADAILGYKALPGDDTEYLKKSRESLNNLVSSSVGKLDITNPTIARELITKARSIVQDPKLIRNQGYLEHVQKEQDRLTKFKDEKDATYMSQAFKFNKDLNQYITPGSGGGDKYNATNIVGGVKGVNTNNEKEPYFNNMPSLKFETPKQAGDYYYSITRDGIDWNRLDTQSVNALRDYANSDGGRQELSDYNMLLETNPNALLNKKGEIIKPEDYLYNSLTRTAMERYGVSITSDYTNALNLGVSDQKANPAITPETFPGEYSASNGKPYDIVSEYGEGEYDDNGNIWIKPSSNAAAPSGAGVMSGGIMSGSPFTTNVQYEDKSNKEALKQTTKLATELNYYRDNYPELKDMNDRTLIPIINQARQKTAQSFTGFTTAGLDAKSLASKLSSLANRDLHIITNKGSKQTSFTDIANSAGMTGEELKTHIFDEIKNLSVEFVPTSKTGKAGWNVQVPTKNGDIQTMFISGSNESRIYFDKYDAVRKVFDKATPGLYTEDKYKVDKDDYGTESKLKLIKNEQGQIVDSYYSINRILSKEMTEKTLKANKLTYQTALQAGFEFDANGRLLINPTGDMHNDVNRYYNSQYLQKEKAENNPNTFTR
jgi:hypothetical protein